uniref:hypothetical protein n=1 Tax=Escherichia coli TaxID=562 RepID=UPI002FBE5C27
VNKKARPTARVFIVKKRNYLSYFRKKKNGCRFFLKKFKKLTKNKLIDPKKEEPTGREKFKKRF